jgi:hypothetical protein
MRTLVWSTVLIAGVLQASADIQVRNSSDSGPGSLRDAISRATASGGGTIRIQKRVSGTIILQSPLPDLTQNITIIGPGADQLTIQGVEFTLFTVSAGVSVTIEGLALTGGHNNTIPSGAIVNYGDLSLEDCNVFHSGAPMLSSTGGLYNNGTASVSHCTFSTCDGDGSAAIRNLGSMTVSACTFTNNFQPCVLNSGGSIILENSVFTGNFFHFGASGEGIHNASGTVVVKNCSIINNAAIIGGGIYNAGSLVVLGSTLARNRANYSSGPEPGGGIYNDTDGTAMLVDTTVSENTSFNQGGGIMNLGTLSLLNCTIASNLVFNATGGNGAVGGGVWNSGTVYSRNSIFAGNTALAGPDFFGVLTSRGFNLIQDTSDCTITSVTTGNLLGVDPLLGPLQDNGGPTYTHALLLGSPAINAGTSDGAPSTDQRGVSRPQGPGTDIGAYEVQYRGQKIFK